ncbi:MAG: signal peptidase I [Bacteriovoracaceae bacterium]|nr:signal peptidase I [Bacteriovoracaceae bacterium]
MILKVQSAAKNIFFLLILAISILAFRFSVIEPYRVPTGSMIPTLMIGDYIFVNKIAYGLRIPFTSFFPLSQSSPKLGDVIVFKFPVDGETNYVKRVVGIPGDTISITSDSIMRNGKIVATKNYNGMSKEKGFDYFVESFASKSYVVRYDPDMAYRSDLKELVLDDESFFVLGDNRDYSYDSRFWGTVKRSKILGRVELIWFSSNYSKDKKEYIIAKDRLFKKVN